MNVTVQQAEEIFRIAVLKCLDLEGNENSGELVRIGWPTGGAPSFTVDQDVAFVSASPASSDNVTRQRSELWEPTAPGEAEYKQCGIQVLTIDLVFYGPNSCEHARAVRAKLQMPSLHDYLARNGVALILAANEPVRVPEQRNGSWWERTDYTVQVNTLAETTETIGTIESIGEVGPSIDGAIIFN